MAHRSHRDESLALHPVLLAMECVLLGMVCLAPWAFGTYHLYYEWYLHVGIAVLLALWAARVILEGQWSWRWCPVALCLAGLFLFGLFQTVPLPRPLLDLLTPATGRLYDELLPAELEILPGSLAPVTVTQPAGHTISFYPAATQRGCLRLLAVFLLFAVVRNNLATVPMFRRLSLAVVVNGALLALFALIQLFSSPPRLVYWTYSGHGSVFGPFLCRNHFPFYVNMAFGLGLGLLFATWPDQKPLLAKGGWPRRLLAGPQLLLARPTTLWICCGLALMLTSVLFSLSRGGVLALLGAAGVLLAEHVVRHGRSTRLEGALLIVLLALALGGWFGLERVQQRLGTLLSGSVLVESRLQSWSGVLPSALSFPLWGTGLGTYPFIERMHQGPTDRELLFWDHAHNEYLEALIEGGLTRLALSLLAIGLIYRLGFRAVAAEDRTTRALALGGLFAFTTLVIHSAGDFGLHGGANAVLATVLGAQLAALGEPPPAAESVGHAGAVRLSSRSMRLTGTLAYAPAIVLLVLAVVLYREVSRQEEAERGRLAARELNGRTDDASRRRQLAYLGAAVQFAPENAELQLDYAEALRASGQPALPHVLAARALCPLLVEPEMELAAHRRELAQADSRRAYLERAKRLHPADATVWFVAGCAELEDGTPDAAWASWRRSLLTSPTHLAEILRRSRQQLQPEEIVARVLPDDANVLVAAAAFFDTPAERRPLLEKALGLLGRPGHTSALDLHRKALIYRLLDRRPDALLAYRAALAQNPDQLDWRCELAELLIQNGQLLEARSELAALLAVHPQHERAQSLWATVERERAAK